ncbi:MAG: hypothetical protein HY744_04120 [Deltaproteobacteria bacterium]|nr:hypothetical protein [Deltaproteobacteria bacterium]
MGVPGLQFVTDDRGQRLAVLLDLRRHAGLWEDIYDAIVARQRESEPRETIESVGRRLRKLGKLRG